MVKKVNELVKGGKDNNDLFFYYDDEDESITVIIPLIYIPIGYFGIAGKVW